MYADLNNTIILGEYKKTTENFIVGKNTLEYIADVTL